MATSWRSAQKALPLCTDDEHLQPFGLTQNAIVKTVRRSPASGVCFHDPTNGHRPSLSATQRPCTLPKPACCPIRRFRLTNGVRWLGFFSALRSQTCSCSGSNARRRSSETAAQPLGVRATVLGVKYASKEQAERKSGGKLIVGYDTGLEAPVEWEPSHGYARCSAAEHIQRDVRAFEAKLERAEAARVAAEEAAKRGSADPVPSDKAGSRGKQKAAKKPKK